MLTLCATHARRRRMRPKITGLLPTCDEILRKFDNYSDPASVSPLEHFFTAPDEEEGASPDTHDDTTHVTADTTTADTHDDTTHVTADTTADTHDAAVEPAADTSVITHTNTMVSCRLTL